MLKILRLHLGLIKFLNKELRKKRTPKVLIYFLKDIGKQYFRIIIHEYKNLFLIFDPTFRLQQKKYKHYEEIKKQLQMAIKILQYVDEKMEKQGIPRWKRQQFWRDFHKLGQVRKELFEDLMKEVK